MNKFVKYIVISASLLTALSACKEREAPLTPLGADTKLAPDGFTITSALQTKQYSNDVVIDAGGIRFAGGTKDSVYFEASFSDEVSWKIEITGQASGAKKYIYGTGTSVSKSNSLWNGSHDDFLFFRQNETAQIILSFYGTEVADTTSITILQSKAWSEKGDHFLVMPTEAQNGFDSEPSYPNWFGFGENGSTIGTVLDIPGTPQGISGGAMRINGNANFDDTFLNGARNGALGASNWNAGTSYLADPADVVAGEYVGPDVKTDPDQVWVNMYVYVPFEDVSKYIEIQLKESDDDGRDNQYSDFEDDAWVHRVAFDKKGWKLVSFRYSDTWASPARDFGGNGNHVREPHRCMGFQVNLYSQVNGESAWVGLDYPIFTIGKPFDPSK